MRAMPPENRILTASVSKVNRVCKISSATAFASPWQPITQLNGEPVASAHWATYERVST